MSLLSQMHSYHLTGIHVIVTSADPVFITVRKENESRVLKYSVSVALKHASGGASFS